MSARRLRWLALAAALPLGGCSSVQSALSPSGEEAERVALLFWSMTGFLGLVFLAVLGATGLALFGRGPLRQRLAGTPFVVAAGLVFPIAALAVLFVLSLLVMAARAGGGDGGLRASVTGEQWWWRVVYPLPDGRRVESANELRIPVGVPVALELRTADVIHSFWVPNLAGKLDMIPGRTNVLTLTATEPGISRGQCAEYCGGAHALMSFHVVALAPDEFEAWLAAEAADAVPAAQAMPGAVIFDEVGCGACHTVRGTAATGVIGPDLTHVGSRRSLAAATLPNDADSFLSWIRDNQHIKPGNRMPPYRILEEGDLRQLALYLESLK